MKKLFTKREWDAEIRQRAETMIANGVMPSLEQVLEAVAETRAKYIPLILATRKENMFVNDDWVPPTEEENAARLKWLKNNHVTKVTLWDMGLLIGDAVSQMSNNDKAHLRAKLYRRYGLLKDSGGRPS